MKALFICATQLQLFNDLIILNKIIDHVEKVVFIVVGSRRGLENAANNLKKIEKVELISFAAEILDFRDRNKFSNIETIKISLIDYLLHRLHVLRNTIEDKYYGSISYNINKLSSILDCKFDYIYLSNYNSFDSWLVRKFSNKKTKVCAVDEGVSSYFSGRYRKFKRKLSKIYLHSPDLLIGNVGKRICVDGLNPDWSNLRLISWLKTIFPKAEDSYLSVQTDCPIWIGQYFGKADPRGVMAKSHYKILNIFMDSLKGGGFVYRPHPEPFPELDALVTRYSTLIYDAGGSIPFEVEILLGYRMIPMQIHTISSTSAIYLYLINKEITRQTKSIFYYREFYRFMGVENPKIDVFLKKVKSKFPDNIIIKGVN